MGIKLMSFYALVGSLGLEKKIYMYLPFEQANLNSVQRKLCQNPNGFCYQASEFCF